MRVTELLLLIFVSPIQNIWNTKYIGTDANLRNININFDRTKILRMSLDGRNWRKKLK